MSSTAKNLMFLETMLGRYMHEHYIDDATGVLYTKPVGFRMPYTRGRTDLESNMKYVEVQLDKYLHTHEQADVGVTTLYWTPTGFRFPYDWKRTNATNDNRRFLETELSKYLHTHEDVTA